VIQSSGNRIENGYNLEGKKMVTTSLIIGSGSFVGSHLSELLIDKKVNVYGTVFRNTKNIDHLKDRMTLIHYDIRKKEKIGEIIDEISPDCIFYLASQNFITPSWEDPESTLKTNILGALYFLEAIRKSGSDPVIEIISSSAVYGLNNKDEIPVKENKEFRPLNPYAVSKIGVDMLAYLYWEAYHMKIIRIRPFNITGPRRTSDVCSDFAKGIVEIEKGHKDTLNIGNLESVRDIIDVRDAVNAMWLLSNKGQFGDVYNLCSGNGREIREILDRLISLSVSRDRIKIFQDPAKMRKTDDILQIGDNSKLRGIGWIPEIPLDQTLEDLLNYWRNSIE
jgi:GDP-4-dehydro-6-deoxy-D-mannose reductase